MELTFFWNYIWIIGTDIHRNNKFGNYIVRNKISGNIKTGNDKNEHIIYLSRVTINLNEILKDSRVY